MQGNAVKSSIDNRRARSEATKHALMRAAEKLVADGGMENLSIREIVAIANQKNESALQYHFKNLTGLLNFKHDVRPFLRRPSGIRLNLLYGNSACLWSGQPFNWHEPTLNFGAM